MTIASFTIVHGARGHMQPWLSEVSSSTNQRRNHRNSLLQSTAAPHIIWSQDKAWFLYKCIYNNHASGRRGQEGCVPSFNSQHAHTGIADFHKRWVVAKDGFSEYTWPFAFHGHSRPLHYLKSCRLSRAQKRGRQMSLEGEQCLSVLFLHHQAALPKGTAATKQRAHTCPPCFDHATTGKAKETQNAVVMLFYFSLRQHEQQERRAPPNTGHTIWFYLGTSAQRQSHPLQLVAFFIKLPNG